MSTTYPWLPQPKPLQKIKPIKKTSPVHDELGWFFYLDKLLQAYEKYRLPCWIIDLGERTWKMAVLTVKPRAMAPAIIKVSMK